MPSEVVVPAVEITQQSTIDSPFAEIDNPGNGNCGFYSFAIGLIAIIQEEFYSQGTSSVYDRWVRGGLSIKDIKNKLLTLNLEELRTAPTKEQNEMLFALQTSLRDILATHYEESLWATILDEKETTLPKIEGNEVFHKFVSLVEGNLEEDQLNELAANDLVTAQVQKLAADTAKSNSAIQEDCNQQQINLVNSFLNNFEALSDNMEPSGNSVSPEAQAKRTARDLIKKFGDAKTIRQEDVKEKVDFIFAFREKTARIKNAFLRDVMGREQLNSASVILKALRHIIQNTTWWATHENLRQLASKFNVNLVVTNNRGPQINNGDSLADRPTVHLLNYHNKHWKTLINATSRAMVMAKKVNQVLKDNLHSKILPVHVEKYRNHLKELINGTLILGMFNNVDNKLDVNAIDKARARVNEKGEIIESDNSFAKRLQEAELRRVGLK